MISEEKLNLIIDKYKMLNPNLDMDQIYNTTNNIINDIIYNDSLSESDKENNIIEFLHLRQYYKTKIIKHILSEKLNEINNEDDYIVNNNEIICNKKIEIQTIHKNNKIIKLNHVKKDKLKNLDYGITKFFIPINYKIESISCVGKHPNIKYKSFEFCLDPYILDLDISLSSLKYIEEFLSHINLDSCSFDSEEEKSVFFKIIEGE